MPKFLPARWVAPNPRVNETLFGAGPGTLIVDALTRDVAHLFASVYHTVLLMLMQYYSFGGESAAQIDALREAIRTSMSMAIRPIAEILTVLPVGGGSPRTAGACFDIVTEPRLSTQLRQSLGHPGRTVRPARRNRTRPRDDRRFAGRRTPRVRRAEPRRHRGERAERRTVIALRFAGYFQCRLLDRPRPHRRAARRERLHVGRRRRTGPRPHHPLSRPRRIPAQQSRRSPGRRVRDDGSCSTGRTRRSTR